MQQHEWFNFIARSAPAGQLARHITRDESAWVGGAIGSSTALISAAMHQRLKRPLLLVVAHLDDADEATDEFEALGIEAVRFPAMEAAGGGASVSLDLLSERLTLVRRLEAGDAPPIIIAPIQALMQTVPASEQLHELLRVVRPGDRADLNELTVWLTNAGYTRVSTIDAPGEFAVRGGIVDVFAPGAPPVRIDLFGDEVDQLHEIDLDTMGSDRRLEYVELVGASVEQIQNDTGAVVLPELLPAETIAVLSEPAEMTEQGRGYYDRVSDARGIVEPSAVFTSIATRCAGRIEAGRMTVADDPKRAVTLPLEPLPMFAEATSNAIAELRELADEGQVYLLCQNDAETARLRELLTEHALAERIIARTHYLHRGFIWDGGEAGRIALIPSHELLHRYQTRRRVQRISGGKALDAFVDMQVGDYVVHRDHGIAKFIGLQSIAKDDSEGQSAREEYLTLEFSGGSKLHVPASKIELVQKYIGAFTGAPELSKLGGRRWKNQKDKVADAVRELAAEMLRIQAAREALPGVRYPADTAWQHEFEAEFPFEETEDQLAAISEVKGDMSDPRPMDRLICGDVGFGKTEVAIRAAFKAAEFGKQVAVLVPTTVLAEQHERSFRERFADYPFRIESISRFKTRGEQNELLQAVAKGQVDVIIGTHRLLSADVKFADLGLVIIDEEQRFGVEHKQRLLQFRTTADVLTLSATPIPRTLHMAMLGLRDISSLTTAPMDRRAIVTEVMPANPQRLKQAIDRELAREGQVFYVHNRVHSIQTVADHLQKLVPEARIIVGHGQMRPRELERVMLQFMRRQADILVCTTIIESGIDIPTANTMFVDDAHMFGLSELHQLRGRVGRYKHRAYCYLLLPHDRTVSEVARKRLRAIEGFSMLGAGFQIALRDLEIRGAGNLLGAEQSGHIAAVGYEMYCQLLEHAVQDLRNETPVRTIDTTIDLGISGSIPKAYIPADARRMDAYRRISRADSVEALEAFRHDVVSAYGELPALTEVLFELAEIRISAAMLGVRSITRRERDIVFRTSQPRELEQHMRSARGTLRLVGDVDAAGLSEIYYRPPEPYLEDGTLLTVLRHRLKPGEGSSAAAMTVAAES